MQTTVEKTHHQNLPIAAAPPADKTGWFSGFRQRVSHAATNAWSWTTAKVVSAATHAKTPFALLYLGLYASSMGYSGGMALIRNEALFDIIPGLALLGFTVGAFAVHTLVSFRPQSAAGKRGFETAHKGVMTGLLVLNTSGLLYITTNKIVHFIAGPEISLAAQIAIPAASVVTSLGLVTTINIIIAKKLRLNCGQCGDLPAVNMIKRGLRGILEYGTAPGAALYILQDAQNSAGQPVVPPMASIIVVGSYAAVGLVNETLIHYCAPGFSQQLRLIVKDATLGISSTAFLTNQAWELEAHAYNGDIPNEVFHPTWAVAAAVTLVPNIMICVKNGQQQILEREASKGERARLLPEADHSQAKAKFVTWGFKSKKRDVLLQAPINDSDQHAKPAEPKVVVLEESTSDSLKDVMSVK